MAKLSLLAAAALLLSAPASGQAPHPDLSGFWGPPRALPAPDAALMAKLPPDTVVIDDTGPKELPTGDYGGLKVKPDAVAKARQWKPEDEMTVSRACAAPSLVYAIQGPFPFEIHQGTEFIVFKYEYFDQVRIIFMDGRGHPPADAPHSKTGHSTGRWDGAELVVDTTHLSASTITNNGLDHGETIHMVERYKLSPDGKTLMASQWFEDPEVLDNNGARFLAWTKRPGEYVFPYDCDPAFATQYQSK